MQEFGDIERLILTRQSVMAYYNWKLFLKKARERNTTQHAKLLKICYSTYVWSLQEAKDFVVPNYRD